MVRPPHELPRTTPLQQRAARSALPARTETTIADSNGMTDAMHRALTDGALEFGNGPDPLCYCVLGPDQLHQGDDYIVSLVSPEKVKEVAAALAGFTEAAFTERYRTIVPRDYAAEYGDEDRAYTWDNFRDVRELYRKAAERNRFVLFTVDQ